MKLKTAVASALFISIFIIGSIILIGSLNSYFIPTYFFFVLFILLILIFSTRDFFENKKDIVIALIIAVFIAGFAVYFADGLKTYEIRNQDFINNNPSLMNEINNLTKNNDYYSTYIIYLNNQINSVNSNSIILQSQIDSIVIARNNPPQQNTSPNIITTITPTPVPTNPERRGERDD